MAASKSSKTRPVSVPPSPLSSPQVTPSRPIRPLCSSLFLDGPFDAMDMLLPFASPISDEKRSYWAVTGPGKAGETGASDMGQAGKRYAAAYFIFLMKNGPDALPLSDIVNSMIEAAPTVDSRWCRDNFFFYLTRLLYLYSHKLSADDVAGDIAANLALEDALTAEE